MIDASKLINWVYLTDPRPNYDSTFLAPLTIIATAILVVGIVLSLITFPRLTNSPWRNPTAQWLRWLGFSLLILIFCRYEGLAVLSMRLLWYLVAIGFLFWLGLIWRSIRQTQSPSSVPEEETKRYQTFDKYLPRPKKRSRAS